MKNTKHAGDIAQAKVMAALLEAGKVVLTPFGDNQRYDIVIDNNGTFLRVQCKLGRLKRGSVAFPAKSCAGGLKIKNYHNQVEAFGVFCPETQESYLVPMSQIGTHWCHLRVDPTVNNQHKNIRWAHTYKIRPQ